MPKLKDPLEALQKAESIRPFGNIQAASEGLDRMEIDPSGMMMGGMLGPPKVLPREVLSEIKSVLRGLSEKPSTGTPTLERLTSYLPSKATPIKTGTNKLAPPPNFEMARDPIITSKLKNYETWQDKQAYRNAGGSTRPKTAYKPNVPLAVIKDIQRQAKGLAAEGSTQKEAHTALLDQFRHQITPSRLTDLLFGMFSKNK